MHCRFLKSCTVPLADAAHALMHALSHPQVAPDAFVLVAGALTEVLVTFQPVTAGPKDIKVRAL